MQSSIKSKVLRKLQLKKAIAARERRLNKLFPSNISSAKYQPRFSLQHMIFSWLGAFLGIATLGYLTSQEHSFIAAPLGATAVLVFGVPDSPLAQPRNVIGGNLIAAIICVTLVQVFGTAPWVMAMAVATTIKLMQLTRTVHPPAGAVALLGVLTHASWSYVLTPVLAGSVVIVFCTILFNNTAPGRTYPKHWL
ncbi:HPP family protein [Phormidium tenue FACHB-886]|nr:HPP family protein [Phormidium tenue FACHB-886]